MIDGPDMREPEGIDAGHVRITDYVHDFARRTPDVDAVVFDGHRTSYRQLESQVVTLARALLASGIKRGDTVAVLSTPRPEFWVSFLATTAIGAIWVGINPRFTLPECRYVVEDARPRLLLTIGAFEGRDYGTLARTLRAENACLESLVCLTGAIDGGEGYEDFLKLADRCPPGGYEAAADAVMPEDPALLVYTSGSTGRPKGALLSHYSLSFGASVQAFHFSVRRMNTMCSFPVNHVSSVADVCCVALVGGGTVHFHERFDPGRVLRCIEDEAITMWLAVPTMFLKVLDHPRLRDTDFSRLELAVCGGAALSESGMKRLKAVIPNVMNVYGMTETAANIVFTTPGASMAELCATIGRPTPLVECRIVADDGTGCGLDEHGELQFRGGFLFSGYLNRPGAGREAYTADGWLKTGDLGYWRADGTITLVGRKSEMYKSGGYNIYPREIELVLESHPSVALAAVVAVPDELYQEVGAAYVMPSGDDGAGLADELREFCIGHLAGYKVPKQFTVSRELPMLPVGKIDKVALKQRLAGRTKP